MITTRDPEGYSATEFPTLYTLTSTKAKRFWHIKVYENGIGVFLCREYGQMGGKKKTKIEKEISIAKSKSTIYEQGVFEAGNIWKEMKDKKGYVEDLWRLSSTTTQLSQSSTAPPELNPEGQPKIDLILLKPKITIAMKSHVPTNETIPKVPQTSEGPESSGSSGLTNAALAREYESFKFLPMLAKQFNERRSYVKYPCYGQPKIDGIRYTARNNGDRILLKTRNDTECPFFLEIKNALSQLNLRPDVFLDGEFYSHTIPFKTLNGYCNRKLIESFSKIPQADLESIHYCLFDCYFVNEPSKPFSERYEYLRQLMAGNKSHYLKLVPIFPIASEAEIMPLHNQFVADGYEGIIIRNMTGPYKLKDRSNDLLKYKNFKDDEFLIVDAKCPTEGNEEGCIIWILKSNTSDENFSCRPRDTHESRRAEWEEYCRNPEDYLGRKYTVRFQETYDNGVPRFPVGISLRQDL